MKDLPPHHIHLAQCEEYLVCGSETFKAEVVPKLESVKAALEVRRAERV